MKRDKRKHRKAGLLLAAALLAIGLTGCDGLGGMGEAESKVDFGQFENPETSAVQAEETTTVLESSEESAEESVSGGYTVDPALMEEFYKSEFSEELLAYFEANGYGEDAFDGPIFESETRLYSKEELDQLSDVMCKIFRNEIYARHGMIFGDEDLNQLYGPFSWYEGTILLEDFNKLEVLPFNEIEYDNITNVVAVEKARKTR